MDDSKTFTLDAKLIPADCSKIIIELPQKPVPDENNAERRLYELQEENRKLREVCRVHSIDLRGHGIR